MSKTSLILVILISLLIFPLVSSYTYSSINYGTENKARITSNKLVLNKEPTSEEIEFDITNTDSIAHWFDVYFEFENKDAWVSEIFDWQNYNHPKESKQFNNDLNGWESIFINDYYNDWKKNNSIEVKTTKKFKTIDFIGQKKNTFYIPSNATKKFKARVNWKFGSSGEFIIRAMATDNASITAILDPWWNASWANFRIMSFCANGTNADANYLTPFSIPTASIGSDVNDLRLVYNKAGTDTQLSQYVFDWNTQLDANIQGDLRLPFGIIAGNCTPTTDTNGAIKVYYNNAGSGARATAGTPWDSNFEMFELPNATVPVWNVIAQTGTPLAVTGTYFTNGQLTLTRNATNKAAIDNALVGASKTIKVRYKMLTCAEADDTLEINQYNGTRVTYWWIGNNCKSIKAESGSTAIVDLTNGFHTLWLTSADNGGTQSKAYVDRNITANSTSTGDGADSAAKIYWYLYSANATETKGIFDYIKWTDDSNYAPLDYTLGTEQSPIPNTQPQTFQNSIRVNGALFGNLNKTNSPTNDSNHHISFQFTDDSNYLRAVIFLSNTQLGFTNYLIDLNLSAIQGITNPDYNCSGSGMNFKGLTTCYLDWNVAEIADGNYFIDIDVYEGSDVNSELNYYADGGIEDVNSSENSFLNYTTQSTIDVNLLHPSGTKIIGSNTIIDFNIITNVVNAEPHAKIAYSTTKGAFANTIVTDLNLMDLNADGNSTPSFTDSFEDADFLINPTWIDASDPSSSPLISSLITMDGNYSLRIINNGTTSAIYIPQKLIPKTMSTWVYFSYSIIGMSFNFGFVPHGTNGSSATIELSNSLFKLGGVDVNIFSITPQANKWYKFEINIFNDNNFNGKIYDENNNLLEIRTGLIDLTNGGDSVRIRGLTPLGSVLGIFVDTVKSTPSFTCKSKNWNLTTTCYYDWNLLSPLIADGNYFIDINVWEDSNKALFDLNSSDLNFKIKNKPDTNFIITPRTNLNLDPENGVNSVIIDFNDLSVRNFGQWSGFQWRENGTTFSFDKNTSRSFTSTGTYTICHDANTFKTFQDTNCQTLTIKQYPQDVNFTRNIYNPNKDTNILFTGSATDANGIKQYYWFFLNPDNNKLSNPVGNKFASSGNYNVCLTVQNNSDLNKVKCISVPIYGVSKFHIIDEETLESLSGITVNFNGTNYLSPTSGIVDLNLIGIATNRYTIALSHATDYGTRYYELDLNQYSEIDYNAQMYSQAKGRYIQFQFLKPNKITLLANAKVESKRTRNTDYNFNEIRYTDASGKIILWLNTQDANDTNFFITATDGNTYFYQAGTIQVKIPKDIVDASLINPYNSQLFSLSDKNYTGATTDTNFTIFKNTYSKYGIRIDSNSIGYLASQYLGQLLGDDNLLIIQPYLVKYPNNGTYVTITVSNIEQIPQGGIRIKEYKGDILANEGYTDDKGEVVFPQLDVTNYTLYLYKADGNLIATKNYTTNTPYTLFIYTNLTTTTFPNEIRTGATIIITPESTDSNGTIIITTTKKGNQTVTGMIVTLAQSGLYKYNTTFSTPNFTNDINTIRLDLNCLPIGIICGTATYDTNYLFVKVTVLFSDGQKIENQLMIFVRHEWNLIWGLSTDIKGDFGCPTTPGAFCSPLLFLAIIISLVGVGGLRGMIKFSPNTAAAIMLAFMGFFTLITWIPLYLFAIAAFAGFAIFLAKW